MTVNAVERVTRWWDANGGGAVSSGLPSRKSRLDGGLRMLISRHHRCTTKQTESRDYPIVSVIQMLKQLLCEMVWWWRPSSMGAN